MLNYRNIITLSLLMDFALCSHAQSVTHNHDATKQNQITVMEIGAGALTPDLYYSTLHNSYKKTAAEKNKLGYRTLAGIAGYQQVEYADSIDSCLTKRAAIEALNVTDRQVDLAWAVEKTKLNNMMERFHNNINRIVPAGGTVEDRTRWNTYYNAFEKAIEATKDAYMPNAQRKKEYLRIYADIVTQNETLVKTLAVWSTQSRTSKMLTWRNNYQKSTKTAAISSAYSNWIAAGRQTKGGSSGSSSSGSTFESGGTIEITDEVEINRDY